jgi:hypothetical protein
MIRVLFILLFAIPAYAQNTESSSSSTASVPSEVVTEYVFDQSAFYEPFSKLLDKYSDLRGRFDYKKLKERRAELDIFIKSLKELPQKTYDTWPEKDKIAFWINAYNALTIKVIIDHYPITPGAANTIAFPSNSIRQIVGAWTGFKHEVMGRSVTLDEIQHTILRGQFKEPRIHFALTPASIGGPRLRREAYLGSTLDNQLTDQSKYFLREASKFYLDKQEKQVLISPIFEWYTADFEKVYADTPQFKRYSKEIAAVLKFLTLHLASEEVTYITSRPLKVSFLEYNWELNEQP